MSIQQAIASAATILAPYVRQTPLEFSPSLSAMTGVNVYLKLENFQVTGSFKARGAIHRLCTLSDKQRDRGVVTASSGNHGAGVAYGSQRLNVNSIVFVPENTPPAKLAGIERYGATVKRFGDDCVLTEQEARRYGEETGRVYISPYNDHDVMVGQGSIGVEIASQWQTIGHPQPPTPYPDAVFIALGGGGLISGVGSYLKSRESQIKIVACSPANSPAMHACLEAGAIIDVACADTLSDSTAGGVEQGSLTFPICQQVIDQSILVTEAEIREAMHCFITDHHMMIEGAAGVAVAALLKTKADYVDKNVVIVICGANIGLNKLNAVLSE